MDENRMSFLSANVLQFLWLMVRMHGHKTTKSLAFWGNKTVVGF